MAKKKTTRKKKTAKAAKPARKIKLTARASRAKASAKTKKQDEAPATQANATRPSDLGGSDRQLQGRFYKSSHHKSHSAKADAK